VFEWNGCQFFSLSMSECKPATPTVDLATWWPDEFLGNRPKCSPNHFSYKFNCGKRKPKNMGYFSNFQKIAWRKQSSNLVTLLGKDELLNLTTLVFWRSFSATLSCFKFCKEYFSSFSCRSKKRIVFNFFKIKYPNLFYVQLYSSQQYLIL
jgi:hypothetical protein